MKVIDERSGKQGQAIRACNLECGDVVIGRVGCSEGAFLKSCQSLVLLENPTMTWDLGVVIEDAVLVETELHIVGEK